MENLSPIQEDSHIVHLWESLKFNIDEHYKYLPKGKLFKLFSNLLYYCIAFPILTLFTKLVYDLKIEGKENIKNLKGGAITVSNHVLVLDCAMTGIACGFKKVYYTTQEDSFKIPFVRRLIKFLRALPIPNSMQNKKHFIKTIDTLLQKGDIIHFYPEGSLCPYHTKIRKFRNGAFDFAVRNNVPVVPMVFKFRKPQGIRKLFKRKMDVTLIILKPISTENTELDKTTKIDILKENVHLEMENIINIK